MLHVIQNAMVESAHTLSVRFTDGHEGVITLERLTQCGGVVQALRDPLVFERVTVGSGGRYLTWPGDIDFCADALWQATQQDAEQKSRCPRLMRRT
jgi:hypothetical protein